MNSLSASGKEIVQIVLRVSLTSIFTYYSFKWLMNQLDPSSANKKKSLNKAQEQMKKLGLCLDPSYLNEHELVIATNLIAPEDISVNWNSIAGLDTIIQEFRDTVVLPIQHHQLFSDSMLYTSPKGVLLHGPPGCGKTLIAKATAKEAKMNFINLDIAMLTDKWYGESQKLASAVFTLATKLQPCIIFIDEIESFLRSRSQLDHEATAMMKTQFLLNWDGLCTTDAKVIVMGATNRPNDLDKAILRRMPAQFYIGLPTFDERRKILQLFLQMNNTAAAIGDLNLNEFAEKTEGFSGSDLRELCRNALVIRVRKYMQENEQILANKVGKSEMPSICREDLLKSYNNICKSKRCIGVDNRISLD